MALNILIVDDSSLTRKRIKRIIEMVNLDVGQFLEAGNGVEALKVLDKSGVGLVLADLNMPDMGGAEMIHRMKSDEATKSIPVVVVSTESKTTRIKELLVEGVKDYLHKPFTPEEFKEIMHTVLSESIVEKDDVLTEALAQALETMAFLTVVPTDEDMAIPEEAMLAEISFTGARCGTIQILAGLDFCRVLAENISGMSKVDDKALFDALKEFANVTCGLFLPLVVSSTADMFDVTVPTAKSGENSPRWDEFVAGQNSTVINIEGYAVATKLIIEDK
jgi:two-component system chemotaxis response regulator CheY